MKRVCLFGITLAFAVAVAGCGSSGGSGSSSSNGHVSITLWEGYTDQEATAIKTLAQQFNATHHNVTVTPQYYGNSDYALQKVLAAIAGGKPPDISYLYGSWAPNTATDPSTVNLTAFVKDPSFGWSKFWLAARNVA